MGERGREGRERGTCFHVLGDRRPCCLEISYGLFCGRLFSSAACFMLGELIVQTNENCLSLITNNTVIINNGRNLLSGARLNLLLVRQLLCTCGILSGGRSLN